MFEVLMLIGFSWVGLSHLCPRPKYSREGSAKKERSPALKNSRSKGRERLHFGRTKRATVRNRLKRVGSSIFIIDFI